MNITSSSFLWKCGKVKDFSIFPQNVLSCIQKCSHRIFWFCLIEKKLDNNTALLIVRKFGKEDLTIEGRVNLFRFVA